MHETFLRKLAGVISTMPSKRKRYLNYLRSPAWFGIPYGKRHQALVRASFRCQVPNCLRPAVQVHHLSYRRLGDEAPEDLCAICLWCHKTLHTFYVPEAANDNEVQLDLPFDAA
jgi:hypothetical protein